MPSHFADRLKWLLIVTGPRMREVETVVARLARNVFALTGATPPLCAGPLDQLCDADRLLAEYVGRRRAAALPAAQAAQPAGGRATPAVGLVVSGEPVTTAVEPVLGASAAEERAQPADVPSRSSGALIALRDEVLLAMRSEHTTAQQVAARVSEQLVEILEADGLVPMPDSGTLDPKRHQVVATRETDDPASAGTIAEVMSPGYLFNDRVVRRQEVVTWRAASAMPSADA
jgi:hypothetical protein